MPHQDGKNKNTLTAESDREKIEFNPVEVPDKEQPDPDTVGNKESPTISPETRPADEGQFSSDIDVQSSSKSAGGAVGATSGTSQMQESSRKNVEKDESRKETKKSKQKDTLKAEKREKPDIDFEKTQKELESQLNRETDRTVEGKSRESPVIKSEVKQRFEPTTSADPSPRAGRSAAEKSTSQGTLLRPGQQEISGPKTKEAVQAQEDRFERFQETGPGITQAERRVLQQGEQSIRAGQAKDLSNQAENNLNRVRQSIQELEQRRKEIQQGGRFFTTASGNTITKEEALNRIDEEIQRLEEEEDRLSIDVERFESLSSSLSREKPKEIEESLEDEISVQQKKDIELAGDFLGITAKSVQEFTQSTIKSSGKALFPGDELIERTFPEEETQETAKDIGTLITEGSRRAVNFEQQFEDIKEGSPADIILETSAKGITFPAEALGAPIDAEKTAEFLTAKERPEDLAREIPEKSLEPATAAAFAASIQENPGETAERVAEGSSIVLGRFQDNPSKFTAKEIVPDIGLDLATGGVGIGTVQTVPSVSSIKQPRTTSVTVTELKKPVQKGTGDVLSEEVSGIRKIEDTQQIEEFGEFAVVEKQETPAASVLPERFTEETVKEDIRLGEEPRTRPESIEFRQKRTRRVTPGSIAKGLPGKSRKGGLGGGRLQTQQTKPEFEPAILEPEPPTTKPESTLTTETTIAASQSQGLFTKEELQDISRTSRIERQGQFNEFNQQFQTEQNIQSQGQREELQGFQQQFQEMKQQKQSVQRQLLHPVPEPVQQTNFLFRKPEDEENDEEKLGTRIETEEATEFRPSLAATALDIQSEQKLGELEKETFSGFEVRGLPENGANLPF